MAQPTNTFDTYDGVNSIREDLADVIYNISPTETPFMSNASKGTATNTLRSSGYVYTSGMIHFSFSEEWFSSTSSANTLIILI